MIILYTALKTSIKRLRHVALPVFFILQLFLSSCIQRTTNIQETAETNIVIQTLKASLEELKQDIHTSQMQYSILEAKITAQETVTLKNKRESEIVIQKIDRMRTSLGLTEEKIRILNEEYNYYKLKIEDLYSLNCTQNLALNQYQTKINLLSSEKSGERETTYALAELRTHLKDLQKLVSDNSHAPIYSYKVLSGDSLEKISQKFNCSIAKIKTLNHLDQEDIIPGHILFVPKEAHN